jgi:hypothetical protein
MARLRRIYGSRNTSPTKYKDILKKEEQVEFDKFWQKYSDNLPLLTNLVHEFCLINSTSVPSESTFSVGGIILGILNEF